MSVQHFNVGLLASCQLAVGPLEANHLGAVAALTRWVEDLKLARDQHCKTQTLSGRRNVRLTPRYDYLYCGHNPADVHILGSRASEQSFILLNMLIYFSSSCRPQTPLSSSLGSLPSLLFLYTALVVLSRSLIVILSYTMPTFRPPSSSLYDTTSPISMPSTLPWVNQPSAQEQAADKPGPLSPVLETARTPHSLVQKPGSRGTETTSDHRSCHVTSSTSSADSVEFDIHAISLGQASRARVLFLQAEKPHFGTRHVETFPHPIHGQSAGFHAVVPGPADTGFAAIIRGIRFTMDFVPLKDDVLLRNHSQKELLLESMPNKLVVKTIPVGRNGHAIVHPLPGYWQLSDNLATFKFLVRPSPTRAVITETAMKRTIETLTDEHVTGSALAKIAECPAIHAQKITSRLLDDWTGAELGQGQTVNMVDSVTGQVKYAITVTMDHSNRGGPAYVFRADWQDGSLDAKGPKGPKGPKEPKEPKEPKKPKVVAFKVFKTHDTTDDGFLKSTGHWKQELEVMRKLQHVRTYPNAQHYVVIDRANHRGRIAACCQPCRLRRLCTWPDDRIPQVLRSRYPTMVHHSARLQSPRAFQGYRPRCMHHSCGCRFRHGVPS